MYRTGDRVRVKGTASVESYYKNREAEVSADAAPGSLVRVEFIDEAGSHDFNYDDLESVEV
jgi:hypothetical protein